MAQQDVRRLTDPNDDDVINWTEKVTDPSGDVVDVDLFVDEVVRNDQVIEPERRPASSIPWLSVSTDSNTTQSGATEVFVNISADVNQLQAGAEYKLRAEASDPNFTTPKQIDLRVGLTPTVTTGTATPERTSATLNGELTEIGQQQNVDVLFEYRKIGENSFQQTSAETVSSEATYQATAERLEAGSVYEYRARVEFGSNQSNVGSSSTFTTEDPIGVSTNEASGVRQSEAAFNGTVDALGGVSSGQVSFEYELALGSAVGSLEDSSSVSIDDLSVTALEFRTNGERFYVMQSGTVEVVQYDLSNPWNVNSVSISGDVAQDSGRFGVSSEETAPTGLAFSSNGEKFFVVGGGSATVYQYSMTTPWDVTTATLETSLDVSSQDSSPTGLQFGPDGKNLYFSGSSNNRIYQYRLAAPFDITTGIFDAKYEFGNQGQSPRDVFIDETGGSLFVVDTANDEIFQYINDVPFEVESGKLVDKFSVGEFDDSVRDFYIRPPSKTLYLAGRNSQKIYQIPINADQQETPQQSVSSVGTSFSEAVTGLSPNSSYIVNTKLVTPNGAEVVGDIVGFQTDEPVEATLRTITAVTTSSARLNGEVVNFGGAATSTPFFRYREQGTTTWTDVSLSTLQAPDFVSAEITGLEEPKTYEYQLVAPTSDGDEDKSKIETFSPAAPGQVSTAEPDTEKTSITFKGVLNTIGGFSSVDGFFEYRQVGDSNFIQTSTQTISSASTFSEQVTGLPIDTEFEFRPVIQNPDATTSRGNILRTSTDSKLSVETEPPTGIRQSRVTLNATVTDKGGAASVTGRFEFRKQGELDWTLTGSREENETSNTAINSAVDYSVEVFDLQPNTTYEFRPFPEASDGDTARGSVQTFTTQEAVDVVTNGVVEVGANSFTVSGTVNNFGGAQSVEANIQRRYSVSNGVAVSSVRSDPITLTSPGSFEVEVNDVPPGGENTSFSSVTSGTSYVVRAFAEASDGDTGGGNFITVKTTPSLNVSVDPATSVTGESAQLNGSLEDLGGALSANVFFEYRKQGQTSFQTTQQNSISGPNTFSASIVGLDPQSTYEYRAVAEASDGDTAESSLSTFDTTVLTTTTFEADTNEVVANASLDFLIGSEAEVFYEYQKVGPSTLNYQSTSTQTVTSAEDFQFTVTGLEADSEYEFRAGATFTDTGTTVRTDPASVNTHTFVDVRTDSVDNVEGTTAEVSGVLKDIGNSEKAELYMEYRNVGASTWNKSKIQTGTNGGPILSSDVNYSIQLRDLQPNINYEVRAVAEAFDGDSDTGSITSFGTGNPLTVQADPPSDVGGREATIEGTLASFRGTTTPDVTFRYQSGETLSQANSFSPSTGSSFDDVEFGGNFAFVSSNADGKLYKYSSDFTTLEETKDFSGIKGFSFKNTSGENDSPGTVLFVLLDSGIIEKYTLRTPNPNGGTNPAPYSLSEAEKDSEFDFFVQDSSPEGIFYKSASNDLFVTGQEFGRIYQYGASFNFVSSFGVASEDPEPESLFVRRKVAPEVEGTPNSSEAIFLLGAANQTVYKYSYIGGQSVSNLYLERKYSVPSATDPQGFDIDSGNVYVSEGGSVTEYSGALSRINETSTQTLSSTGGFSETITGLSETSPFIYRTTAEAGGQFRISDGEQTFTTQEQIQVQAPGANSVTENNATLVGDLQNLGEASQADVFFEYREAGGSFTQTPVQTVSVPQQFTADVFGLTSGTNHEYRAVVQASDGDSRSSNLSSFQTLSDLAGATLDPTDVDEFVATLNGELQTFSGASSVDVFFEWREVGAQSFNQTPVQTITDTGQNLPISFDEDLTGLATNTDHEFRAVFQGSDGDNFTASLTLFRTGVRPRVQANPPNSINSTEVVISGEMTKLGDTSTVDLFFQFESINDNSLSIETSATTVTSPATISETITGLDPNTLYRYKVIAEADNGFRSESAFQKLIDVDFVGQTASTESSATVEGSLQDAAGATSSDVFFRYRKQGNSTFIDTPKQSIVVGAFTEQITGLDTQETYEIQAVSEGNNGGVGRSAVGTFNTDILVGAGNSNVTPIGDTVTAIGESSLEFTGIIEELGGFADVDATFQIRKSGSGNSFQDVGGATTLANAPQTYTVTATGLDPNTQYDYRAKGVLSTGKTIIGEEQTATTDPLVQVTTGSATKIIEEAVDTGVKLAGTVDNNGGAEGIDTVTFEYRETGASTFQTASDGVSTSVRVTGLSPDTEYEFRITATASDGDTAQGSLVTFTTQPLPDFETNQPSFVGANSFDGSVTVNGLGGAANADIGITGNFQQVSPKNVSSSEVPTDVEFTVEGLSGDTNITYQGTFEGSDDDVANANQVTLTTDPELLITIPSGASDNVTDTSITVTGKVTDLGGANSTDAFFQYRIKTGQNEPNNAWQSTNALTLQSAGTYQQTITGLQTETDFEIKAVAVASDGDNAESSIITVPTQPDIVVVTDTATRVGGTSADLNATVGSLAGISSADAFFEVKEVAAADFQRTTDKQTISSSGSFSDSIGNLDPETVHEYRAVVEAPSGNTGFGVSTIFETIKAADLEVSPATDVTATSAVLNGTINTIPQAQSAEVLFEFKEDADSEFTETSVVQTVARNNQGNFSSVSFDTEIRSLSVGTLHQFRPVAKVSNGDRITGPTQSFETTNLITVRTDSVENIDDRSATLNATFQSLGTADSAETFIQFRQVGETTWQETPRISVTDTATTPLDLREDVTTLVPEQSYEFRGAVNGTNVDIGRTNHRGDIITFSTGTPPTISTLPPVNVESQTATLKGSLDDLAGAASAQVFFEYRETGAGSFQESSRQTLTSSGEFTAQVTGLSPETTHEYKARVIASDDGQDTGSLENFTTEKLLRIQTVSVNIVDFETVDVTGDLIDLGSSASGDVFFEYREDGDTDFIEFPASETLRQTKTSPGQYTVTFDGLQEETQYDFRAKVIASDGDVKTGDIITKAMPKSFTLVTEAATDVGETSATLNGRVEGLGNFNFDADVHFRHRVKSEGSKPYDFETAGLIRFENSQSFYGMSNDGTKAYDLRDNGNLVVEQYALDVPFSLEGNRRVNKEKEQAIDTRNLGYNTFRGVQFFDSGNVMLVNYETGNNTTLAAARLSTPYEVDSVTSTTFIDFDFDVVKGQFNGDGSELYILPRNSHRIEVHELSSNYELEKNFVSHHNFGQNAEKDSFLYQPFDIKDDRLYFNQRGQNQTNRIYQYRVPNGLDSAVIEKQTKFDETLFGQNTGEMFVDDGKKLFGDGNAIATLEWNTTQNQNINNVPTDVSQ